MRNSTKTELRTLREVAHFLLPLVCCEFCGKPLLDPKLADKVFGDKAHTPLKFLKLTIHHRNGKHRDNKRKETFTEVSKFLEKIFAISGNLSLMHRPCHGEHEMKLNHHKRKVMKVKPLWQRAKEILNRFPSNLSVLTRKRTHSINETGFIANMFEKLWAIEEENSKKKFTRYEIRRLKKLAVKVEDKK